MIKAFKKSGVLFLFIVFVFVLSSCASKNANSKDTSNNKNNEQRTDINQQIITGMKAFKPDSSCNFEVIFFDTDNVISEDGQSFENVISDLGTSNKTNNCSDCYMIKCDNIEILVDCGNQIQYGTDDNRRKNFCKNIIKKILTYCTDGELDYLIVTHADFDHIEYLEIDGGLFDMIINYENWFSKYYKVYNNDSLKNIFGEEVQPINKILNIIDFDSYRVRKNSSNDNGNNNLLISTDTYKNYCIKRDKVINVCNASYSPAGSFFNSVSGDTKDSLYHNYYAIPYRYYNLVYKSLNGKGYEPNLRSLIDDLLINTDTNKKYENAVKGDLKKIKTDNGDRYTFDIDLKKSTKLRILYNWYYDSYYQHTFDSQDRNNISVCMLFESGSSKLLLLGDLGGYGESGLLRYYDGTDVINNVSCFKLSHHGSTANSENSSELFSKINTESKGIICVLTGVAQANRDFYKQRDIIDSNKRIYDSLSGVAVLDKKLLENLNNRYQLFCTQIVRTNDMSGFYNQPFYGDIHISFTSSNCKVMYDYSGEICTYINNVENSLEKSKYIFKTVDSNGYILLQDLKWFEEVDLKGGN